MVSRLNILRYTVLDNILWKTGQVKVIITQAPNPNLLKTWVIFCKSIQQIFKLS